ncbi:MAG TPA: hypothetical protein VKE71_12885 [Candidatus Angelobacter sp.]|nr:hypothetical protein [Candidatus Angelobacter sp.]
MKKFWRIIIVIAATCGTVGWATEAQEHNNSDNPNPALFEKDSHPFGADMATWGERVAQWIYQQPFATNPGFDQTGADCANEQQGPVWFIPPIFAVPGSPRPIIQPPGTATRNCTIPHQKAIFLDIGEDVNDFPCPASFNFNPAPGQSLFDFLIITDKPVMDSVNLLEVWLDGQPLHDILTYRFISDDLFLIKGDVSLQGPLDPCITGSRQPAIIDGFFLMFRPLDHGAHTIVVHGTNTFGDDRWFTYKLNID